MKGYTNAHGAATPMEKVTVNVSAEEGEVSGYEVTISKVNKYGSNNEYTQVEYIESNAKQYIDTGFIPDSNTRVVMDAEVPDSSSAVYVFGVNDWTSGARFQIRVTSSSTTYTSDYGSSGINTKVTAVGRLIFDKNKNVCTIGGVVTEHTAETFTCASSLKLLAGVNTSGSHLASPTGQIYSCQIYDNDILVRDYIPVIDSNGVAGLWDKVNGVFYQSDSSTAFVAGNLDGDVIATQTTPSASYKIPYGTSYTIKASDVSGYPTPAEQSFTASQPTRNVDVTYSVAHKGVFIQDIYGRLYTQDEWDGTQIANGVAVITDNCSFVVAKEDALSSNIYWGGSDIDIPTLTNYNKSTDAATDFDGLGNTSKIITAIGNTNDGYRSGSAAGDCRNYIFSNGVDGYLGSAGEWQAIHDNKEVINSLLALIGGQLIASSHYWTSTERDSERAFETWFGDGATGINDNYKYYDFKVRPLAKLISQDDITTFYINITKHSCVKGTTWGQWCKSSFNTDGWYVDSDGSTIRWDRMIDMGIIEYVDEVSATDVILSGGEYYRNEKEI